MTDYRLRAETGAFAIAGKAVALESRVVRWVRKWHWPLVALWALVTLAGLLWTLARGDWWDLAVAFCVVVATYFLGRGMESTERTTTIDRR